MARKTLLFAIHNHQPDGNFDEVFAHTYRDCYRPLIDLLLEFPKIRCALHFTGALLEWIEHKGHDLFPKIRTLVERGQAELLGGGFYEPMLAILPDRDALGQLQMMSDYLAHNFGTRPRGMWLAERVWEPGLPRLLHQAGIAYTMVDDGHFRYAGMEGPFSGYYVTEKAGATVAVFPIAKELRNAIPFRSVPDTLALLESLPDGAHTYGDDGEKFGVWPGTHEWVWQKGWLREFFARLSEPRDLELQTFSEYMASHAPAGRVYLPTASYEEMGEWALPPVAQRRYLQIRAELEHRGALEQARPFLRGGIWQNFLAKYDEANFMHKKMVYVSDKLAHKAQDGGLAPDTLEQAHRELYRAQCNCSYWHGLFGGLYLGYLRHAVYSHLISAEMLANPPAEPRVVRTDYDADLQEELLIEGPALSAYVKPSYGGALTELDDHDRRWNLLNVLSRHEEAYHQKLRDMATQGGGGHGEGVRSIHDLIHVKEAGLDGLLVYDRQLRLGFLDHFLPGGTALETFARVAYEESGDFAGAPYRVVAAQGAEVALDRAGTAYGIPTRLGKRYRLRGRTLELAYRIEMESNAEILFAPELSLFLDTAEHRNAGAAELGPTESLTLRHDWLGLEITLRLRPAARIWRFPLETASQSESGFERTYQGTVLALLWREAMGGGRCFEPTIELEISNA